MFKRKHKICEKQKEFLRWVIENKMTELNSTESRIIKYPFETSPMGCRYEDRSNSQITYRRIRDKYLKEYYEFIK